MRIKYGTAKDALGRERRGHMILDGEQICGIYETYAQAVRELDALEAIRGRRPQPREIQPEDSLTLPGMETADADREAARRVAEAAALTAAMRTPRGNISAKAGRMEKESPLFYGTGDNPVLF